MAILKHITMAAAVLTLTSCYTDFEPDIDSSPVLCVNSTIECGEPMIVNLSRTWRWDERADLTEQELAVTDAKVNLYVNDRLFGPMECVERDNGYPMWHPGYSKHMVYCNDSYIPAAGDVIRLEVDSPIYGPAAATETVPHMVAVDSVRTTLSNVTVRNSYYRFDMNILVFFTDPVDALNYYELHVNHSPYKYDEATDSEVYFMEFRTDMSGEPLFTEHVSTIDMMGAETSGYTIFSDRQISGHTYGLKVRLTDCIYKYQNPGSLPEFEDSGIDIDLYAISPSYYKHVLSVWECNDALVGAMGAIGLGPTVPAYSNVTTHAGIVAAKAVSRFRVRLPKLLEQYISDDSN